MYTYTLSRRQKNVFLFNKSTSPNVDSKYNPFVPSAGGRLDANDGRQRHRSDRLLRVECGQHHADRDDARGEAVRDGARRSAAGGQRALRGLLHRSAEGHRRPDRLPVCDPAGAGQHVRRVRSGDADVERHRARADGAGNYSCITTYVLAIPCLLDYVPEQQWYDICQHLRAGFGSSL